VTAQSERPAVQPDERGPSVDGVAVGDGHRRDQRVRASDEPLAPPFRAGGLGEVFRRRYLLRLIVTKQVRARYQGSLLGVLWSYVQPLVRFSMYFFVIGLVLGLHKDIPNFAIHMFAAMTGVHFFTEAFSLGTRAVVSNKAIVRKMPMPREMFPVSAVLVAVVDALPQVLILFVGAVAVGWRPDAEGIGAGLLGFAVITVLGTALALLFSAMNVFFRDFQNIVSTFTIFTHWIVPMIYPFSKLAMSSIAGTWLFKIYLMNPLTIAVLLLQRAFWVPTLPDCHPHVASAPRICLPGGNPDRVGFPDLPDHLFLRGGLMLVASLIVLGLCQMAFTRLESKFADRL
jgi:ABC-2 type transport system permease protein